MPSGHSKIENGGSTNGNKPLSFTLFGGHFATLWDIAAATVGKIFNLSGAQKTQAKADLGIKAQSALLDDTATSITPPDTTGLILFMAQGNVCGLLSYATTTPQMTKLTTGGDAGMTVTTGALTGTTGTDGKFTISAHTDGKLYFENRLGFGRTFAYQFLTYGD